MYNCNCPRTVEEQICDLQKAVKWLSSQGFTEWNAKGEWVDSTQYSRGDFVDYGGSSYICVLANVGYRPDIAANRPKYWQIIAEKGDQGEQGIQGERGEQGIQGLPGERGLQGNSIESVNTISHTTVGGETVTKLRVNIENAEPQEIEVHAQNGQSITDVVAGAPVEENGYTRTPISFFYNGSDVETVDVVAKNGADGQAQYVQLNTISGTLTDEQMRLLTNPNNGIIYGTTVFRCNSFGTVIYYISMRGNNNYITVCSVNRTSKTYEIREINNLPVKHTITFRGYTSSIAPFNFGFVIFTNRRSKYTVESLSADGINIPYTVVGGTYFTTRIFFDSGVAYVSGIKLNSASDFNELTQALTIEEFNDTIG